MSILTLETWRDNGAPWALLPTALPTRLLLASLQVFTVGYGDWCRRFISARTLVWFPLTARLATAATHACNNRKNYYIQERLHFLTMKTINVFININIFIVFTPSIQNTECWFKIFLVSTTLSFSNDTHLHMNNIKCVHLCYGNIPYSVRRPNKA